MSLGDRVSASGLLGIEDLWVMGAIVSLGHPLQVN